MHNPFDQLAKQIGKEALDASGLTIVQREISRDAQHADILHDPDPTRGERSGGLGAGGGGGSKPSPTTEEQEFIMIIHTTFAEAKEIAWNAGRVQEAARALLTVLRVRGIALQEAIRERIQAEKDPERLERWLEKAAVATSIAEVLDEAS